MQLRRSMASLRPRPPPSAAEGSLPADFFLPRVERFSCWPDLSLALPLAVPLTGASWRRRWPEDGIGVLKEAISLEEPGFRSISPSSYVLQLMSAPHGHVKAEFSLGNPTLFAGRAHMLRVASGLVRRRAIEGLAGTLTLVPASLLLRNGGGGPGGADVLYRHSYSASSLASSPSLSIWRRKKEMGKEGLFVVQQLKRLASVGGPRFEQFMRSHVSRLLRTDLLAVLAEFQRQDHVFLSMKIYYSVRKEVWYRPDMYFYRDMLMMLARNKKVEEAKQVWADLKSEDVHIDQHTYGDIVRAFSDGGLPALAMEIYDDMRSSPDPPLSLPFRVMLKGLIPYPGLREKVKQDFLELFPDMIVYDPPEDLFDEQG